MSKNIKWFGLLCAVASAISAFATEIANQQQNDKIIDMEKRITNLEKRGAE